MPRRLPIVLTERDLPLPELNAARLDGEVFVVGAAWAPVDEIESASHRAAALRAGLHDRLIAEQFSAAWIWGAVDRAPLHQQLCASIGARVSRTAVPWCTVREVVIEPDEFIMVSDLAVTTLMRTIVDVLRFAPDFGDKESRVIRSLMGLAGCDADACRAEIDRRRNLPNKRRALARLALATASPS